MTVLHDFNKFWDMMLKRPGTWRKPLTQEQRDRSAAGVAPDLPRCTPSPGSKRALRQPWLCDPHQRICSVAESDAVLEFLFRPLFFRKIPLDVHRWSEGDVLLWDDIGTLHNAHADYGPDEHRLIKRCQVMADRIFDPDFVRAALG